jgi:hypothetical protein
MIQAVGRTPWANIKKVRPLAYYQIAGLVRHPNKTSVIPSAQTSLAIRMCWNLAFEPYWGLEVP